MKAVTEVPLKNGGVTLVDTADLELVSGFPWTKDHYGYAVMQRGKMYLKMHRLILGAGTDEQVDHINGQPLDNRSINLRIATGQQNMANRGKSLKAGRTSKYKGVSWRKDRNYWVAWIHYGGKTYRIGNFKVEEDAARAYDAAAFEHWGEYARLNNPDGQVI